MAITSNDTADLDKVFEALGNKHRREIISRLSLQPSSISQLAAMRDLSLPAIHKHMKVLEEAGLIRRKKSGRTNFVAFNKGALRDLQAWVARFHTYWGSGEESLENYIEHLSRGQEQEKETT